jgi:hypothetical protein
MTRRLGWLLFIVGAAGLLVLLTWDLLPTMDTERGAFQELIDRGVDATARVSARRESTITTGEGDTLPVYYVTLEHTRAGTRYTGEFNCTRSQWERLAEGAEVQIRLLPENPRRFYAPAFLVLGGVSDAAITFWVYLLLALAGVGLLGALLYKLVLRP